MEAISALLCSAVIGQCPLLLSSGLLSDSLISEVSPLVRFDLWQRSSVIGRLERMCCSKGFCMEEEVLCLLLRPGTGTGTDTNTVHVQKSKAVFSALRCWDITLPVCGWRSCSSSPAVMGRSSFVEEVFSIFAGVR